MTRSATVVTCSQGSIQSFMAPARPSRPTVSRTPPATGSQTTRTLGSKISGTQKLPRSNCAWAALTVSRFSRDIAYLRLPPQTRGFPGLGVVEEQLDSRDPLACDGHESGRLDRHLDSVGL